MWVITNRGFFSAVQSKDDPNVLVVRARCRDDLAELSQVLDTIMEPPPIVDDEGTDYPVRLYVPRTAWDFALRELASEIDYTNFKDSVTAKQGKRRHDIYLRVWGALRAITPREGRRDLPMSMFDRTE